MTKATSDGADLGDLEDLADLCVPKHLFADVRREQALDSLLDVIDNVIDNLVVTNLNALVLGKHSPLGVGDNIEADDDRLRCLGKQDVRFGNPANCLVNHANLDLFVADLLDLRFEHIDRALHIRLEHHKDFLEFCIGDLGEHVVQGELRESRAALRVHAHDVARQPSRLS